MRACLSAVVTAIGTMAILLVATGDLQAENRIKVLAGSGNPGSAGVFVPVAFSNDDAMEGYSLAIRYDAEALVCTSVIEVGGHEPDFLEFTIDEEEGTVVIGVILAFEPEESTTVDASPDELVEQVHLVFDINDDVGPRIVDIEPENGLGSPPIDNVFSVGGADVIVSTFDSAPFTILNPNEYRFEAVSPLPGATFTVALHVNHPEDFDGYSVEISFDVADLTLLDISVEPTETLLEDQVPDSPDIEFLEIDINNDDGLGSIAALFDNVPPFDSDKVVVAGTDQHFADFEFTSNAAELTGGDTTTIDFFQGDVGNLVIYRGGEISLVPDVEKLEITFATPDDELPFIRGDSNTGGRTDLADAIFTLKWLFSSGREPTCMKAVDTNGDGVANIADPIVTIFWLFLEGREPAPPFPDCGLESPPGSLTCEENPEECQDTKP